MSNPFFSAHELSDVISNECRQLSLHSKKSSDSTVSGLYRSLHKGSGIEFEEVRLYTVGDDTRKIDWKVTARKSNAYVKSFREEKEQLVFLLCDISPSLYLGKSSSFLKTLIQATSFIASMAAFNGDSVGACIFDSEIRAIHKPQKGVSGPLKILTSLQRNILNSHYQVGKPPVNLTSIVDKVLPTLRSRSLFFIISDFICSSPVVDALTRAGRRNDVFGIWLNEDALEKLPESGLYLIVDPETGKDCLLDFSSADTRQHIHAMIASNEKSLLETFVRARAQIHKLSSSCNVRKELASFFTEVQKRRVTI